MTSSLIPLFVFCLSLILCNGITIHLDTISKSSQVLPFSRPFNISINSIFEAELELKVSYSDAFPQYFGFQLFDKSHSSVLLLDSPIRFRYENGFLFINETEYLSVVTLIIKNTKPLIKSPSNLNPPLVQLDLMELVLGLPQHSIITFIYAFVGGFIMIFFNLFLYFYVKRERIKLE
ncbi:hypothetical protein RCL1_002106 [Eukaryota sp. TZLM3-RCL]